MLFYIDLYLQILQDKKQILNLLTKWWFYDTISTVDSTDCHDFYNICQSYIATIHYFFPESSGVYSPF